MYLLDESLELFLFGFCFLVRFTADRFYDLVNRRKERGERREAQARGKAEAMQERVRK